MLCLTRRVTLLQDGRFKEACSKPTSLTARRPGSCCPGWREPSSRDSPSLWRIKREGPGSPGTASHTRPVYMEANQGKWGQWGQWEQGCSITDHMNPRDGSSSPSFCPSQERLPRFHLPHSPVRGLELPRDWGATPQVARMKPTWGVLFCRFVF